MKRIVLITITAVCAFALSCDKTGSANAGSGNGEWVSRIEYNNKKYTIYESEMSNMIDRYIVAAVNNGSLDPSDAYRARGLAQTKQGALEEVELQYLAVAEGEKEKVFDTPEAKAYLDAQIRMLKSQYYVEKKYLTEEEAAKIPPSTERELQEMFDKARAELRRLGYTSRTREVDELLDREIRKMKLQERMYLELRDLRDEAKILRNKELVGDTLPSQNMFGDPSQSMTPGGAPTGQSQRAPFGQ